MSTKMLLNETLHGLDADPLRKPGDIKKNRNLTVCARRTTPASVIGLHRHLSDPILHGYNRHHSAIGPALLEKGPLRFVITDSPSDSNMSHHVRDLCKLNVKHVCRASEPSYSTEPLEKNGIQVHEFVFKDGEAPPENVLQNWLNFVEKCFIKKLNRSGLHRRMRGKPQLGNEERISVHCVAGLGRAPVLVAVALVEYCRLDPNEAVDFIRMHRRGAINKKQVSWLREYVPRTKASCSCIVN